MLKRQLSDSVAVEDVVVEHEVLPAARQTRIKSPIESRSSARSAPKQVAARLRNMLVIDVGGTSVKALISGTKLPIKLASGPAFGPTEMLNQLLPRLVDDSFEVVTIGIPAPVVHGRVVREPRNLGRGWVGFDFKAAFARPVRLINDAAMQALGSHVGGHMLFLGLGTGLGSAAVLDGVVEPLELAHLPFRKHSFEYYVGEPARKRLGGKKWRANVHEVIDILRAALQPDYVVLGGGNVRHLGRLPTGVSMGGNDKAFLGGFRVWEQGA